MTQSFEEMDVAEIAKLCAQLADVLSRRGYGAAGSDVARAAQTLRQATGTRGRSTDSSGVAVQMGARGDALAKRIAPRLDVGIDVNLSAEGSNFTGTLRNISLGGAAIDCDTPLDQDVTLTILLDDGLTLSGEIVAWHKPTAHLSFEGLTPAAQSALADWLEAQAVALLAGSAAPVATARRIAQ